MLDENLNLQNTIESTDQAPVSTSEQALTEQETQHLTGLLTDYNSVYGSTDGPAVARLVELRNGLINYGDKCVDPVYQQVIDGKMEPKAADVILFKIGSEKALDAVGKILNSPAVLEFNVYSRAGGMLANLAQHGDPETLQYVEQFANTRIDNLREQLKRIYQGDPDREYMVSFYMDDLSKAVLALQRFPDRVGIPVGVKVYEEYEKLKEEQRQLRQPGRERLKTLIDRDIYDTPLDPEIEKLPEPNPETRGEIRELINNLCGENWSGSATTLVTYRALALRDIYRAWVDNTAPRNRLEFALDDISYLAEVKITPTALAHSLLLHAGVEGFDRSSSLDRQLVESILDHPQSRSVAVLAEFARLCAEKYLESPESTHYQAAAVNSLSTLGALASNLRSPWMNSEIELGDNHDARARELADRAEHYYSTIELTYPELHPHLEFASSKLVEGPYSLEKGKWQHEAAYIKGPALIASMLDRGRDRVDRVDLFVTFSMFSGHDDTDQRLDAASLAEIKYLLDKEEYDRIALWFEKNGYTDKGVTLTRVLAENLDLEDVIVHEPKFMAWDKDVNEFGGDGWDPGDYERYKRGELITHPEGLESLSANGSLTAALGVMDLGRRFGLEYDNTIFRMGEKKARDRDLVITTTPTGRTLMTGEAPDHIELDPTFFKTLLDKDLRKTLIQGHQRLGSLASDIVRSSGMKKGDSLEQITQALGNWISSNYGEVYIDIGQVQLYDINLTRSNAPLEAQRDFLSQWYRESKSSGFGFVKVGKLADDYELPKTPEQLGYIDQEQLQQSLAFRAKKAVSLDKLRGRYEVEVAPSQEGENDARVAAFLRIMGVDLPPEQIEASRVGKTLVKLGVDERNPILARFDKTPGHKVDMVITNTPEDILLMSTDKEGWYSCYDIRDGAHEAAPYTEVAGGSVVVYIMDGNRYVSRKIMRPGITLDTMTPAVAIERTYGDERYNDAMMDALESIAVDNNYAVRAPMVTNAYNGDMYFDSSSGPLPDRAHRYYYTGEAKRDREWGL